MAFELRMIVEQSAPVLLPLCVMRFPRFQTRAHHHRRAVLLRAHDLRILLDISRNCYGEPFRESSVFDILRS